jgi:hypothetical protein
MQSSYISSTPPSPRGGRTAFRWHTGTLEQRLAWLFPELELSQLSLKSRELGSNGSFVNFVRHHRLRDAEGTIVLDFIEKSIRKIVPISSQEARLHRHYEALSGCTKFRFPEHYGIMETPFETLLYTSLISGRPPRMHLIGGALGRNIAELELSSHKYIESRKISDTPLLWSMDFHRPWFLLRPRFNFERCLPHLDQLAKREPRFRQLSRSFAALRKPLDKLAQASRDTPRCLSHMDYLRKNLFQIKRILQLIDWSEVKIGRVGFDGGAYLGALFRRSDMPRFYKAREMFMMSYTQSLSSSFKLEEALSNLDYIFLLTALYHCLRPETLQEYQDAERLELLREKHEYLLSYLEHYPSRNYL